MGDQAIDNQYHASLVFIYHQAHKRTCLSTDDFSVIILNLRTPKPLNMHPFIRNKVEMCKMESDYFASKI